jgi:hypothetical protein
MQTKTSQQTTTSTTHTIKATEPAFGSDEYMIGRGYRPATAAESEKYGKLVNQSQNPLVALMNLIRLRLTKHSVATTPLSSGHVVWQIEGAISLSDHRSQAESDIPQSEVTQNEVFEEQHGQWQRADLAEPALQC